MAANPLRFMRHDLMPYVEKPGKHDGESRLTCEMSHINCTHRAQNRDCHPCASIETTQHFNLSMSPWIEVLSAHIRVN
jgi:hypothetical protein